MTTVQKIIKYLAIALAIALCVSIIGGIVGAIASIDLIFGGDDGGEDDGRYEYSGDGTEYSARDVTVLDVDISALSLSIKRSENNKVRFECDDDDVEISCKDGTLEITEKSRIFNIGEGKREAVLYLPEGLLLSEARIEVGAGVLYIEALSANELDLDLGAGSTEIDELNAYDEADIDGGAGKIVISGGTLTDLDFDMGAGRAEIKSLLKGNCKLDIGVGACTLELVGGAENYTIEADKGIGRITVDGRELSSGESVGSGDAKVKIDGGIGDIAVDFTE